ncbi:MAG: ORF6N domain-containing protein [Flavobacterium sp.]|uniref:ORF6N domain-containing protein n=1 Tax=Flavobacterium sp. TaxID=239 RepID=UPI0026383243|nr:ORF6N domain-containing protein [Flavobacterium sp.]MDD5150533.1 ORF6N domain-containing protein [Flavobacterium sp.]
MSKEILIPDDIISSKIYLIRKQKVMLDRDLSELYAVETKQLKRQVRRNLERFPDDFMFELSQQEFDNLRSQFGTSSWGGSRYMPMAFTEQGVAMLSSVLNSPTAIKVNIQIIRVFTKIREMLTDTLSMKLEIEEIKKKLSNHTQNIELVFNYLDELIDKKENLEPRKKIGY